MSPTSTVPDPSTTADGLEHAAAILAIQSADPANLDEIRAAALAVLYRAYASAVLRVARRYTVHAADADDVVHDVFLRLPHLLSRYHGGDLRRWLSCVAMRAAQNFRRHHWRECRMAEEPAQVATTGAWSAIDGEEACSMTDLHAAVAALPDTYRTVLELRVYHDCSHASIARQLGITVAASEIRLCRAVKLLRQRFVSKVARTN